MPVHSPLASVSATRRVMDAHGLSTKKSLGQHFLVNDGVVGRILELAQVSAGDKVLEVGPGIGTLTAALLGRGAQVLAIERDPLLPEVVAATCANWDDSLAVLRMDALDVGPQDLATTSLGAFAPSKFVANLPYAVAATLALDYFERFESLQQATVMVQAEVADRMMARPGSKDYGAYTVKLALQAQAAGRFKVGPGNFLPPPRVDSAVVRLDRVQGVKASLSPEARACAATMADAAFANRRKTLLNSCKAFFAGQTALVLGNFCAKAGVQDAQAPRMLSGAQVAEALPGIFEEAGIDPSVRGETLDVEDFVALGTLLAEL